MSQVAKLFMNGRSQAVRLPAAYRFEDKEVLIRRDEKSGDVILSRKPKTLDHVIALLKDVEVPQGFPWADRGAPCQGRDPFEGDNE